jgi:formylglycine-generating enzyme
MPAPSCPPVTQRGHARYGRAVPHPQPSRWRQLVRVGSALLGAVALPLAAEQPAGANPAGIDWQAVGSFEIARTETTVAQFQRFVATTGRVTQAERQGGGQVYEAGWVRMPGWTWRAPFGTAQAVDPREPAVHISFDEARDFCRWAGGRLPTDAEWLRAAYTEQRAAPPPPFVRGTRYPYPTGTSPEGAQCLAECGSAAAGRAVARAAGLSRGAGHARTGDTPAGVNGLYDMGGNAWEWVDESASAASGVERRTRGGSWWYGAGPMRAEHLQGKPPDTTVVYIGFRCARSR